MKKVYIFILLTLLCSSICRAGKPPKLLLDGEEVELNNIPIIDGPYSTYSLRSLIAAKLLGVDYFWPVFPPLGSREGYLEILTLPASSNNESLIYNDAQVFCPFLQCNLVFF